MDDVAAALAQLERSDPFTRERYDRDPSYAADVHAHAAAARQLAEETREQERLDLLAAVDGFLRYQHDGNFRAEIDRHAILAAIAKLNAIEHAEPPQDERPQ